MHHHPNHDKSMISQNDTESPQPVAEAESLVGVASTDLLAFSSILGGLLASGHYTERPKFYEDGQSESTGLICDDYGEEWREYQADDPTITGRFVPLAMQTAEMLLRLAKRNLEANDEAMRAGKESE